MNKKLFYVIYLVVAVPLLILSIEVLGRIIIHFRYGVPGKSYGIWRYDAELGADHCPNSYNSHTSLNNYGFRNKEDVFELKPKNSLRIIAFGGSTTFGFNLKDEETFTFKLEQKLRQIKGLEKTQVLNAGRITFSAGQTAILVKRLAPKLKPDYVIIYEGTNELNNALILRQEGVDWGHLTDQFGVLGKGYDQNRWLKRNSVIVRFVDYYFNSKRIAFLDKTWAQSGNIQLASGADASVIHPWIVENYKFLLRTMIDSLKGQRVKPIVIRYAMVGNSSRKKFSDISYEVAHSENTLLYDMDSDFKQYSGDIHDLFISSGLHVTPEGADIIADGLFRIISTDLKIAR